MTVIVVRIAWHMSFMRSQVADRRVGFRPPLPMLRPTVGSGLVISWSGMRGIVTLRRCTFRAGPGSFVFLPRNVPRTFVVESDTAARMLTLLTPGGGEGVFIDGGRPAEQNELPPAMPPDIEALKQVSGRYGAEIVGPPMARTGR